MSYFDLIQPEKVNKIASKQDAIKLANDRGFDMLMKQHIRNSPFIQKMFDNYGVPFERLDELTIKIEDLHGRHAKSNEEFIMVDEQSVKECEDPQEVVHYIVHELTHWLTRQREEDNYFANPEELKAFTMGMAYELVRGSGAEAIIKLYKPIFDKHLEGQDSMEVFNVCFSKATNLANNML